MKRISIFGGALLWCVACGIAVCAQSFVVPAPVEVVHRENLVPRPVSLERGNGAFALTGDVHINFTSVELKPLADYLSEFLPGSRVAFDLIEYAAAAQLGDRIYLKLDHTLPLPGEGYRLEVRYDRIEITGKDYGGVWNGIQTLLQLLPPDVYVKSDRRPDWVIEEVSIEDYPRMAYRGVMLDVARTFVPKEDVLRLIDNISHHKINKFHWHLADDEGWRIEIKSYPRLAEVGGFRGGDSPIKPIYGAWDERYGGYYTQDDIREVVAYAATRNVEIIPEIDLPGHSRAAAIAYPEILCDYTPDSLATAGYDIRNVWCVSREENYAMLDHIIGEIAALFPSGTIHLGGDEVETAQWSHCPDCKALMARHGITEVARLQDLFMKRVVDIAASHGKTAGVWNEAAANSAVPKSTTVWGWESIAAARATAAAGYPTVVCAGSYFYFDMRQSPADRGHIWAGIVTLEKVYSFDPTVEGFTEDEAANLRGIEATFFSELLLENGLDFLDYQLFPRVSALSEVAWTQAEERSWSDFQQRLQYHFDRLDAMGIGFCRRPVDAPATTPAFKTPAVTFTSSLKESARHPFSGVSSYKAAAWTTTTCTEGHWFAWTFAAPVTSSEITIKTGYDHLQRAGVPEGTVEVSYDGVKFETVAPLHDLKAVIVPEKPIRAIRIVCGSHGNGESFVIVQPLKIR